MIDLFRIAQPIVASLPLWVTVIVLSGVAGAVLYIRLRGASLDEHVSMAKATKDQMETLIGLNKQLSVQIEAMRKQITELEAKIDELEAELRKARGATPEASL